MLEPDLQANEHLTPLGVEIVGGRWRVHKRQERGLVRELHMLGRVPSGQPPAREARALVLAATGCSAKEIAHQQGVSVSTAWSDLRAGLARAGLERFELGVLVGFCAQVSQAQPRDAPRELVIRLDPRRAELPATLSQTEREIACRLLAGRSNLEIARERGSSPHTIANQVGRIFRKLGIRSRAELFVGAWAVS